MQNKDKKRRGTKIRAVVTEVRFSALGKASNLDIFPSCAFSIIYIILLFVVFFHAWQTTLAHHNYRLVFSSSDEPRPVLETGTPLVAPTV